MYAKPVVEYVLRKRPRLLQAARLASLPPPTMLGVGLMHTPRGAGILRSPRTPGTGSSVRFGVREYEDGDESLLTASVSSTATGADEQPPRHDAPNESMEYSFTESFLQREVAGALRGLNEDEPHAPNTPAPPHALEPATVRPQRTVLAEQAPAEHSRSPLASPTSSANHVSSPLESPTNAVHRPVSRQGMLPSPESPEAQRSVSPVQPYATTSPAGSPSESRRSPPEARHLGFVNTPDEDDDEDDDPRVSTSPPTSPTIRAFSLAPRQSGAPVDSASADMPDGDGGPGEPAEAPQAPATETSHVAEHRKAKEPSPPVAERVAEEPADVPQDPTSSATAADAVAEAAVDAREPISVATAPTGTTETQTNTPSKTGASATVSAATPEKSDVPSGMERPATPRTPLNSSFASSTNSWGTPRGDSVETPKSPSRWPGMYELSYMTDRGQIDESNSGALVPYGVEELWTRLNAIETIGSADARELFQSIVALDETHSRRTLTLQYHLARSLRLNQVLHGSLRQALESIDALKKQVLETAQQGNRSSLPLAEIGAMVVRLEQHLLHVGGVPFEKAPSNTTASHAPSQGHAALDDERAALESERAALESDRAALDMERAQLDAERRDLEVHLAAAVPGDERLDRALAAARDAYERDADVRVHKAREEHAAISRVAEERSRAAEERVAERDAAVAALERNVAELAHARSEAERLFHTRERELHAAVREAEQGAQRAMDEANNAAQHAMDEAKDAVQRQVAAAKEAAGRDVDVYREARDAAERQLAAVEHDWHEAQQDSAQRMAQLTAEMEEAAAAAARAVREQSATEVQLAAEVHELQNRCVALERDVAQQREIVAQVVHERDALARDAQHLSLALAAKDQELGMLKRGTQGAAYWELLRHRRPLAPVNESRSRSTGEMLDKAQRTLQDARRASGAAHR